jgi:hypothetical protein
MKKKIIFFYTILILFFLNTDSSQIKSNNKKNKRSSKITRKKRPTKKQKKRMNRIFNRFASSISNPISVDYTLEKKKDEIKALLANILNSTPRNTNDRERITQAITNQNFSIKGISLDTNGNIIDSEKKIIILTKDEIAAIDINKEITKDGLTEIAEKTKKNIIEKSNGALKENNGNIVDENDTIIIAAEKIKEAIEKNTENKDSATLKDIFQPAINFLESKGVEQSIIKEIKLETLNIHQKIKDTFTETIPEKTEKTPELNNDFIFRFDFDNENISNIIINSIKYFKPFNDGIIDIFGILYTFDDKDFSEKMNDDILFNDICVLKKFALNDNQTYKEIKKNIESYWEAIKESLAKKEFSINNDSSNNLDNLFGSDTKNPTTNTIQNTATENIINKINGHIEKFSFDEKLRTILLYMYGLIVYCDTQLADEANTTKKDFFTIFINQLIEKTKIREEGIRIFADQIFKKLTRSNISFSYQDIKQYLTNKSLLESEAKNQLCLLMQNSEFNLLLLFNIINTLKPIENHFNGIKLKDNLIPILNEQKDYEKKIAYAEKKLLEIKTKLTKNIKDQYPQNNIKVINNYLNADSNAKNTINNKEVQIFIPYFKAYNAKTSKQEYLNFDILRRYNNILLSIQEIKRSQIKLESNYINIYDIDFKTQPNKYTNQLFQKLLQPIEIIDSAEKEGEENTIKTYDVNNAINYINEIEKYKNYNNENSNILELINMIINTINLDYYFKKHLSDINTVKQNAEDQKLNTKFETINKIHNYFIETNNLFLEYLNSIYNLIKLKRNYIQNFDKTASQKAISEFLQKSITPAIISAAGITTYLIGIDNWAAGAQHLIDAGTASGKFLGDLISNNPKTALIFASLAGVGTLAYNWLNRRTQQYKDGHAEKTLIKLEKSGLNEINELT